jgi:hypothetical protein
MRNIIIYTLRQRGFGGEARRKETTKERPSHRWEDNIKINLKEYNWVLWAKFIWLRIWTSGGFL